MPAKYERIKRHEVKALVETEYGIKVMGIHESNLGIMLFTDQGMKRLKKVNKSYAKIMFAASAYAHIKKNGFIDLSSIHLTHSGQYTICYAKWVYILQDYVTGKPFEVNSCEDAALLGRTLAKFHCAAQNFVPVSGSSARVDWGRWLDKFKSYERNLRKHKESIMEKNTLTKMDSAFLKLVDHCCSRLKRAHKLLVENNYLGKVSESMQCNQLTHKSFRKHAILLSDKEEVFITELENCGYDIREYDLAIFLESFTGKRRLEWAEAALGAFAEILPLDIDSIKIIQAFLLEPKKTYRIIDRYYGKKKNDTEAELIRKLEKSAMKEIRKDELISMLENWQNEYCRREDWHDN